MLKSVFLTGVGGQGVVTMANLVTSHLQSGGMKVSLIHATGMAQRGGRVTSEIRFSDDLDLNFGPRISTGGADFLIGMDRAETINSAPFISKTGILLAVDYALIPSQTVLKKEHFPDIQEVETLFSGLTGRVFPVVEPERPMNMYVLGVFAAVCAADEEMKVFFTPAGFEATLKAKLTKRVEDNLAAFRKGCAAGRV